jgi:hypothetical protein
MNLHLGIYFTYSGPLDDLNPLVGEIGKLMIERGYGVDIESDNLTTLLILKESDIGKWVDPSDFAKSLLDGALVAVVPANGKSDEEEK